MNGNPFYVQPGNQFGQGLQALAGTVGQVGEIRRQQERADKLEQGKAALNEAFKTGDPMKVQEVVTMHPELSQVARERFGVTNAQTEAIATDTYSRVMADPERALEYMDQGIQQVAKAGGNPINMVQDYAMFKTNPQYALKRIQMMAPLFGLGPKKNAAYDEFQAKATAAGLVPGTPEYERAARVALGIDARAGTVTGQERIATTPGMTETVATSESIIEGAKAGSKEQAQAEVQLDMKPKIQAAVKQVEQEAKDRGETASSLARAKAAMPGLLEVSQKLKTLADLATYTMGGKAVDEIVKQLGFGSTEGANARAKMISIVDNQVLPLLRDTFGAAFTAAEGERLRNTLLDPDAAPEAKKSALDAFIDQKVRDIETKEREMGAKVGETPKAVNWSDL